MALCLPNEQMLQLTFPPLFLRGEGVQKTLAYSQQHLLATVKFKQTGVFFPPFYFSALLNITVEDNSPFMQYYSRMI